MKVNFFLNVADLQCIVLANMGLHTKAIATRVGMTPGMTQYRIALGGAKGSRRSFRDGDSPEFKWAFAAIRRKAVEHARKAIETHRKSLRYEKFH